MLAEMTGANEKLTTKRYINVHIAFIIQKSLERVWHEGKYMKMLDFLELSYCRILSIFSFMLSFRKNKYQIHSYSYLTWMIPNDLYIWKPTYCCVFLNKQEVLSRFFKKSNIFKYFSTCQTRSDDFWILNAMCMCIYLSVVYFSFALVGFMA